jgi:hypothetical protein
MDRTSYDRLGHAIKRLEHISYGGNYPEYTPVLTGGEVTGIRVCTSPSGGIASGATASITLPGSSNPVSVKNVMPQSVGGNRTIIIGWESYLSVYIVIADSCPS